MSVYVIIIDVFVFSISKKKKKKSMIELTENYFPFLVRPDDRIKP